MEFIELCRQKTRMCKKYNNCANCPIELHCERNNTINLNKPEELEMLILEWMAENTEKTEDKRETKDKVEQLLAAGQKMIINNELYMRVKDVIKVIREEML